MSTEEAEPSSQVSHESQGNQQDVHVIEASMTESASVPSSRSDNKKVSREDIELVQNLIERCLQLYLSKGEVVRTLSSRARIEPGFTSLVWQKLEEENSDFFRAYYIRLKLKNQIIMFNHLLEHQFHLMKYPKPPKVPLAHIQNGIHSMSVNNLPMGYPVLQQPPVPATGQTHLDSMGCGLSSCHVVNGIPVPDSFHPIRMNSGNDFVMNDTPETASAPPCNDIPSVSEMAVSPSSVASNNHFPFAPSEMSGMGMNPAALDMAFTSDMSVTGGLQLGVDIGVGPSRSLGQLWNFSLSDLTADLTNLGDLGPLGDYTGSPFLPPDSGIMLDSPDQDDVEEFFADTITEPCSQSDEDKS